MDALLSGAGRPVAYYASLVPLAGSVNAALMLSQLIYWTGKGKRSDGWIFKIAKEWEQETGLSKDQQDTARKHLRATGIVYEKKKGIPPKVHFRIDQEALRNRWRDHLIARSQSTLSKDPETPLLETVNPSYQKPVFPAYIPETTQKSTAHNTTEMGEEERDCELRLREGRPQTGTPSSIADIVRYSAHLKTYEQE